MNDVAIAHVVSRRGLIIDVALLAIIHLIELA
jgi:hypothetical protein